MESLQHFSAICAFGPYLLVLSLSPTLFSNLSEFGFKFKKRWKSQPLWQITAANAHTVDSSNNFFLVCLLLVSNLSSPPRHYQICMHIFLCKVIHIIINTFVRITVIIQKQMKYVRTFMNVAIIYLSLWVRTAVSKVMHYNWLQNQWGQITNFNCPSSDHNLQEYVEISTERWRVWSSQNKQNLRIILIIHFIHVFYSIILHSKTLLFGQKFVF
jgi:hypothetical protein